MYSWFIKCYEGKITTNEHLFRIMPGIIRLHACYMTPMNTGVIGNVIVSHSPENVAYEIVFCETLIE